LIIYPEATNIFLLQDTRFLQQRDEESGPLGYYSGSTIQLSLASVFFDYFYSQDRRNVLLRNDRNYQSARSHPKSLQSSYFKIMNGAGVLKSTISKTQFRR